MFHILGVECLLAAAFSLSGCIQYFGLQRSDEL